MELSGSNIKKYLTFSQKKAFLIFLVRNLGFPKTKFIFQKKNIPKKFLILQEIELSSPSLKKLPIFQEETIKSLKKLVFFLFLRVFENNLIHSSR